MRWLLNVEGTDQGWAGLQRPGLGEGTLWTVSPREGVGAQGWSGAEGRRSDWEVRFFPKILLSTEGRMVERWVSALTMADHTGRRGTAHR